jgi:hypothetical protein
VRTKTEAHHVAREGEVWTVAEIAVLIERLGDDVRQVKRTFPGSAVVEVRDRDPSVMDWEKGDDPPLSKRVDGGDVLGRTPPPSRPRSPMRERS